MSCQKKRWRAKESVCVADLDDPHCQEHQTTQQTSESWGQRLETSYVFSVGLLRPDRGYQQEGLGS